MIGQRWWEQALLTVIGPTIISSLRRSTFGNSVTCGKGCSGREDLAEVHLRHAPRGVLRVVVALGVDHQALEHALHPRLHLVEKLRQLPRLDVLRDVVVGVEALPRRAQALADPLRDRGPGLRLLRRGRCGSLVGHGSGAGGGIRTPILNPAGRGG